MGKTKSSGFAVAVFDKPPYYEHEVIANLEELSLTSAQGNKELNQNFQNISNSLHKASYNIVNSIEKEAEKARIQSAIEHEQLVSEISETNYRLLDVANGITGLTDVVREGSEETIKAIHESSAEIVDTLHRTNYRLASIGFKLDLVNKALNTISSQLGELIKKIAKPNETEALELADQARINLALNKKETALKVTRNALELSNGTSITVLAYHILTLSLFDDDDSKKEIIEIYEDYVNLIKFKLTDVQSDMPVVVEEINSTLFPVMATMGNMSNHQVMLLTQILYTSLFEQKESLDNVLKKPLVSDITLEMISYPNHLREFHWSVLLKEYVIKKRSLEIYNMYIVALANSHVLIKNELMVLAIKHFNEEGFLYGALIDSLSGNEDDRLDVALKVVLSVLPQDIINVESCTYYAIKRYSEMYNIEINDALKNQCIKSEDVEKEFLQKSYLRLFSDTQADIDNEEKKILKQIHNIEAEYKHTLEQTIEEYTKHNVKIDNMGLVKEVEQLTSFLRKSYSSYREETGALFMVLGAFIGIVYYSYKIFEDEGWLFWSIVMSPISGTIGYYGGGLLAIMFGPIIKMRYSYAQNRLQECKKMLATKYDIDAEKEKIAQIFKEKIESLLAELLSYKEKRIKHLTSRYDALIEHYTPRVLDKLTQPIEEIKECIEQKLFGDMILGKRPNDLKFKYIEYSLND